MQDLESPNLELRPARTDDEDFLLRVFASARDHLFGLDEANTGAEDPLIRLQFNLQREHFRRAFERAETSIVLLDRNPAGSLIVEDSPAEVLLVDIALLPEVRGRGIGRTLIQRLLEHARIEGKPVRLRVMRGNPAMNLYADLGFESVGESEVYVEMEWLPIEDEPSIP